MSELKPCPFCGGEAETVRSMRSFTCESWEVFFYVLCKGCGARVEGADEAEAIEAWNTRHERTCELIKHAAYDEESGIELVLYECDKCGWIVDPWRNERYCPNCGAKVVEHEL